MVQYLQRQKGIFCRFLKFKRGINIDGDVGMAQTCVSQCGSAGVCPVDHDCRKSFVTEEFLAKGERQRADGTDTEVVQY